MTKLKVGDQYCGFNIVIRQSNVFTVDSYLVICPEEPWKSWAPVLLLAQH